MPVCQSWRDRCFPTVRLPSYVAVVPAADDMTGAPRSAVDLAARWRSACNCSDTSALVSLYEDTAVLVAPTGEVLEGRQARREALTALVAVAVPVRYLRDTRRSLEANGVALFVDNWTQGEPNTPVVQASPDALGLMVARRQSNGAWLIAIDVSHGTI
jgi:ketosteroid isomerase-like protein